MKRPVELILFAGLAGDRNDRAMAGAALLADTLGAVTGLQPTILGAKRMPLPGGWAAQLRAASEELRLLATATDQALGEGKAIISTMGRCAAGLATLPVIARHHPDAVVVWFDAHGDCNVPLGRSPESYLGGMVLTGAAGMWNTGLGGDLDLANVILVGSRNLDPPEQDLLSSNALRLVKGGPDLAGRLSAEIAGRPVYIHIDCDVLDPGIVPTEYSVAAGLTIADLAEACAALAGCNVIGMEIAEFEATWPEGRAADPALLEQALAPLLDVLVPD